MSKCIRHKLKAYCHSPRDKTEFVIKMENFLFRRWKKNLYELMESGRNRCT